MNFDLILEGATLVTSTHSEVADIGIRGGKIAEIGSLMQADASERMKVSGLALMPGIIDTQVHFREPGLEHKEDIESGTRAAICGGVTTVFEMPNTNPATTTRDLLDDKLSRAKDRAWCHIAFFVGAASDNLDQLQELEMAPGTPGIKLFMGSSTGSLLVSEDELVRKVLQNGTRPVPVHSEDHERLESRKWVLEGKNDPHLHPVWRDSECARLCTERLLRLAEETGRHVHILHISTLDEIPMIEEAKKRGIKVTAEVTPQHLFFAAPEAYDKWGTFMQMNPPIRSQEHRIALRDALKRGVFDVFGSDHAPHTREEKDQPYPKSPSGMPGVQTLGAILLTLGRSESLFSVQDFVRMACERPAELYGIKGKGRLKVGCDADLALFDLNAKKTIEKRWLQSKCGWSTYEGEEVSAWPVHTLLMGEFAVREGELQNPARGRIPEFTWKAS